MTMKKVKAAMDRDSPPDPKRARRIPKPQKALCDMTDEERRQHDAELQRRKALESWRGSQASAKRCADKVRRALEQAQKQAEELVTVKSFPAEMKQHYMDAFIPMLSKANELLEEWTVNAKVDLQDISITDLDEKRTTIETKTKLVEDEFKTVDGKQLKGLKTLLK